MQRINSPQGAENSTFRALRLSRVNPNMYRVRFPATELRRNFPPISGENSIPVDMIRKPVVGNENLCRTIQIPKTHRTAWMNKNAVNRNQRGRLIISRVLLSIGVAQVSCRSISSELNGLPII